MIGAKDSTVGKEELIEDDADVSTDAGSTAGVVLSEAGSVDDAVAEIADDAISLTSSTAALVTSGTLSTPYVASIAFCVVVEGSDV